MLRKRIRSGLGTVSLICLSILLVGAQEANCADKAAAASDAQRFNDVIKPILAANCFACHSGAKPKGDFPLDQLKPDFADEATREHWLQASERVAAGEMPPKGKPRPAVKDVQTLSNWIDAQAQAALAARRAADGRVVLRRLNRVEYENTVRDLLGVQVDLQAMLPLDSSAAGFDNVGARRCTVPRF